MNDTAILKTGTQAQRITTADGYIFGLSIKSGLAYLRMRPFTAQEYESLPHVIMTSDKKWDPSIFDSDNEPTDESFPPDLDQLPTKDYDVQGEYIRAHHIKNNHDDDSFTDDDIFEDAVQTMDEDYSLDLFWIPENEYNHLQTIQRCIHSAVQDTNSYSISNSDVSELKSSTQPRTHRPSPIDYKKLQPYFAWLPIQMIKDTFQNSTQYGFVPSSPDGNLFKRYHSPNPAMNVFRLQDDILTDTIFSDTPAIDGGYTQAQVFFGAYISHCTC